MTPTHKMITCIIPMGAALPVVERLRSEKGIDAANINFARGIGRFQKVRERRLGNDSQKEILSVVVEVHEADEIFRWIFEAAEIDRPHGGIIYMTALKRSSEFRIPDSLEPEQSAKATD